MRISTLFCCLGCLLAQAWAQLPPDFSDQVASAGWEQATGFTFAENGLQFVWEKAGKVYRVENDQKPATPLIDLSEEVADWRDHGLLGFALHPNFLQNGYCYLLYAVDRHHLLYHGTPQYHPDSSSSYEASIGRITRYQADPASGFTRLVAGSRKVLLGRTIDEGIPLLLESHGLGTLLFGTDGSLLVSCGDGASHRTLDAGGADSYAPQALQDGIIPPQEDVGSYRAQQVNSLSGKILRLDPETGDGLPSNPFFDPTAPRAPRSRVWALGFRNPFRMCLQPGTGSHSPEEGNPGTLYVGDNGWFSWEEINVVERGGQNFGWPLYEGMGEMAAYFDRKTENPEAPNPLAGTGSCWRQHFLFQDLLIDATEKPNPRWYNPCDSTLSPPASVPVFMHTRPALTWANDLNPPDRVEVPAFAADGSPLAIDITDPNSPVEGDVFPGASAIGGSFYTGTVFPEEYRNAYYFGDYAFRWIQKWDLDSTGNLVKVAPFVPSAGNFIHMETHPVDGCLYYLPYEGPIHKLCYGGNLPPQALATADRSYGPGPLTVAFEGSQSFDPQGEPITFLWRFGDGDSSTEANPVHTFFAPVGVPTPFYVTLEVRDSAGARSYQELVVSVNNTPPQVNIRSFEDGDYYSMSGPTLLALEAEVRDAEHAPETLTYTWQTFLHHNTHFHPEKADHHPVTSTLITPVGCETEIYYYRISLEVSDPAGLSGRDEGNLYPYCGPPIVVFDTFALKLQQDRIDLHWSMKSVEKVQAYYVERAGPSGSFRQIGERQPGGSVQSFSDLQPEKGDNHYRIKAVSGDGLFEYSPTLSAPFPPPGGIDVYPNPAWAEVNFNFPYLRGGAHLQIRDVMGQSLYEVELKGEGPQVHVWDVRDLPAGIYCYRIVREGEATYTGKLVKVTP